MTTTKLIALAAIVPGGFAVLALAALLSFLWKRMHTNKGLASAPAPFVGAN